MIFHSFLYEAYFIILDQRNGATIMYNRDILRYHEDKLYETVTTSLRGRCFLDDYIRLAELSQTSPTIEVSG